MKSKWHYSLVIVLVVWMIISNVNCAKSTPEPSLPPAPTVAPTPKPPPLPIPAEPPVVESEPKVEPKEESVKKTEVYSVRHYAYDANKLLERLLYFRDIYVVIKVDTSRGEGLMHKITVGGYWITYIPVEDMLRALEHAKNTASLLEKGKLPGEVMERPPDKSEVSKELENAKSLLTRLLSSTYAWQEEDIERIKELGQPTLVTPIGGSPPYYEPPKLNAEIVIPRLVKRYDDYREELGEIISDIDYILEKLPVAE